MVRYNKALNYCVGGALFTLFNCSACKRCVNIEKRNRKYACRELRQKACLDAPRGFLFKDITTGRYGI